MLANRFRRPDAAPTHRFEIRYRCLNCSREVDGEMCDSGHIQCENCHSELDENDEVVARHPEMKQLVVRVKSEQLNSHSSPAGEAS